VAEWKDGKLSEYEIAPEAAGIARTTMDKLKGGDPAHNAEAVHAVLGGTKGPFRDIVLLNSAAALMIAGKAADLKAGVALAAQSIDSGAARKALETLVRISNEAPPAE
jgi:anthranilate phosphoribosyltransferase